MVEIEYTRAAFATSFPWEFFAPRSRMKSVLLSLPEKATLPTPRGVGPSPKYFPVYSNCVQSSLRAQNARRNLKLRR
jgi:hypothetical protein